MEVQFYEFITKTLNQRNCQRHEQVGLSKRTEVMVERPVRWRLVYMITIFDLVVPTCPVFRETGVVHRIISSFSYLFLLVSFTHFIIDIKKSRPVSS
jgi:hypothetical protein